MIKEISTTVPQHITTIKSVHCDDCNKKLERALACSVARCEMCRKDLCDNCVGHEVDTMGDYREVYCNDCWRCGEHYRNSIKELENKIDDLNHEWLNECMELKGKKL